MTHAVWLVMLTRYLKQQYNLDHIPTLFVATKSDLDLALQVRKILFSQLKRAC